jgi:hypothetical protein
MKLHYLLIALLAGTSACANSPGDAVGVAQLALTPMGLIANIDAHKGQTVIVAGYFTSLPDARALWENESAYRDAEELREGSWDKCITIYPASANAGHLIGQYVRFTGRATVIEKNDIRSFWTCNPVALEDAVIVPG